MSEARPNCTICDSEKGKVIHAWLAAGRTPSWMERELRELGQPTKAETIRRHVKVCLNGRIENSALLQTAVDRPNAAVSSNPDFALAIRNEANRLLAAGKLQVSAAHGLKAQELLDRRVERQADRQLMVELAGLLAGRVGPPADLIEVEYVEARDVTPAAIE